MKNIILIHGAWGGAWEFTETIDHLTAQGHTATAIDLPGHGDRNEPIWDVTMEAYVQTVVDAVAATNGTAVLVGHSLAGAVISQAAERIPEQIDRLVYACALLPADGDTPLGLLESDPGCELLPKLVFSDDKSFVTIGDADVREIFLHDVADPNRVDELVPHFAVKQAVEPFTVAARLTAGAFGSVRKTYIRGTLDRIMSLALQDRMIKHWDVERVLTLESGHFPLMSQPERLGTAIGEAIRAAGVGAGCGCSCSA